MFFELSCFFDDPTDVGSLISGSSAFSKSSLSIWKFMVHELLKPGFRTTKVIHGLNVTKPSPLQPSPRRYIAKLFPYHMSSVISPFSFLSLLIWFFSQFFLWDGQWFVYFIYLLKEPAFSFVDFCYSLLCFFFSYFCSQLYDVFLSTNFGVVLFLFFY